MKTKINQIIHDMHTEDMTQVENIDKIGFDVGVVTQDHETFEGTQKGTSYCYIKSAEIYFPISEDSADAIVDKIARLIKIKKDVEEIEEERKKHEVEKIDKGVAYRYIKISLLEKKEIRIPRDAIRVKRIENDITWFEPRKGEKWE